MNENKFKNIKNNKIEKRQLENINFTLPPDRILSTNFSQKPDNKIKYVPGELIVKFRTEPSALAKYADIDKVDKKSLLAEINSNNELNKKHLIKNIRKTIKSTTKEEKQKNIKQKFPLKESESEKESKKHDFSKVYTLTFDEKENITELLKTYSSDPNVEFAQLNYIYEPLLVPNDFYYQYQYAHQMTGAEYGWNLTTGNESVVIAIIDTGMNYTHEDLINNVWNNTDETANNGIDDDGNGYIDDIRGWDFVNDDNDPMDDYGHGTMTAGAAAAKGNNTLGVAGVCWKCKIMNLKAGGAYGTLSTSDIIGALEYAIDNDANIISMSFGGKYLYYMILICLWKRPLIKRMSRVFCWWLLQGMIMMQTKCGRLLLRM